MRLYGIMCFSSSIICLLIVTSPGSVHGHLGEERAESVSGHHAEEGEGSVPEEHAGASGMTNDSEYRPHHRPFSGLKSTLNSPPRIIFLKHHTHDYLTHHFSNSSSGTSKNVSNTLRKKRSAEMNNYSNEVSSETSTYNSFAGSSQPPIKDKSLPSSSEEEKDINADNHQNHSHNDSEKQSPKQFSPTEKIAYNPDSHADHDHNHVDHDHDYDHNHDDHDHDYDHYHDGHNHEGHGNNHSEHDHIHDKHYHNHNGHSHGTDEHGHHEDEDEDSSGEHQHHMAKNYRHLSASVWLYASVAVVIISLCGLLSVAVIPIMQKWFYHTLLQFLVGLAVGSLSGDGLLHLMPHAMLGGEESHDHNNHNHKAVSLESIEKNAIWRGLAALGGIFLFFIAERLLGALTAYRRKSKEEKLSRHTKNMMPVMQREDGANNGSVGEKLAQPKKNSYDHITEKEEKETIQMLETEGPSSNKGSPQLSHEIGFHGRSSFSLEPEMNVAYRPDSESSVMVSDHHGHSHVHTHEIPHSVSAVALMVIMGDGLHNFCDGLAIGAAFASSDADGVSTTVAVFCHELPHELGDFAMLLKTGMKVKQALFYNGLSSILCFFGMIIGIFLGNVNSATNWVFAGTAGMFLYIALVDMLPELTTGGESGKAAVATLAVQVFGIVIGICVMLLIALYEHKLPAIVS